MNNWIKINDIEYSKIWDGVYKHFSFKPSIYKKDWPSFKEPSPSITFDISKNYEDSIIDEWYEVVLNWEGFNRKF
ncbi:DUF2716 domain-containing protein [Clostridium paraputrificum]|uniref:DUF2716 domain-containing protein n=1 Tax=Clostridium paraputrificum TaxID=29363 RepID=UPI003D333080